MLYIVLFLHQTATASHGLSAPCQLYIVLFLHQTATDRTVASNYLMLYIVLFLHQTATLLGVLLVGVQLYIVLFLHQTATIHAANWYSSGCISFYSYIKPQLLVTKDTVYQGCISFYSYIKPQHFYIPDVVFLVVYRSIPTSNRNRNAGQVTALELYIVLFLHQTATSERVIKDCLMLYIVLFLHQTATGAMKRKIYFGCISFYSYIKPQLHARLPAHAGVVYRSIPTSNRNHIIRGLRSGIVVYRSIPTSNRNEKPQRLL